MNLQANQNNLKEEETSVEEDLSKEVEEGAETKILDATRVGR